MSVGTGSIKRAAAKAQKPAEAEQTSEMPEETKTQKAAKTEKPAKRAAKPTQKTTAAKNCGILDELPIYLL